MSVTIAANSCCYVEGDQYGFNAASGLQRWEFWD